MVLYICDKCNKEYDHKGSYLKHLERKIPCDQKQKRINKNNIAEQVKKISEISFVNKNTKLDKIMDKKNSNNYESTENSVNEDNEDTVEYDGYSDSENSVSEQSISENIPSNLKQNIDLPHNHYFASNYSEQEYNLPKKTKQKKNKKNNLNKTYNVDSIIGDDVKEYLVLDKILDKITNLLSNSSHTTNIYVKDNATIIYNGYKNEDSINDYKDYLENKKTKCSKNFPIKKNVPPVA
jgi:hypothetical protein